MNAFSHPPSQAEKYKPQAGWRNTAYQIIFEAETPAGKRFDVFLLIAILLSVFVVIFESIPQVSEEIGFYLRICEWTLTILFSIEYILRLVCVQRPLRYAVSFYGLIDLLAVLPSYLGLALAGLQPFIVIRTLRLLRLFRIFKLTHFLGEAHTLAAALKASQRKIIVFLATIVTIVIIVGTLMYIVEGKTGNGFSDIPKSMYWAIVTMTTVGYGDIVPQTTLGRMIAALLMIAGYGIIAVPTGIVSAELVKPALKPIVTTRTCLHCTREGHDYDATHCKYCGFSLTPESPSS